MSFLALGSLGFFISIHSTSRILQYNDTNLHDNFNTTWIGQSMDRQCTLCLAACRKLAAAVVLGFESDWRRLLDVEKATAGVQVELLDVVLRNMSILKSWAVISLESATL